MQFLSQHFNSLLQLCDRLFDPGPVLRQFSTSCCQDGWSTCLVCLWLSRSWARFRCSCSGVSSDTDRLACFGLDESPVSGESPEVRLTAGVDILNSTWGDTKSFNQEPHLSQDGLDGGVDCSSTRRSVSVSKVESRLLI